MVADPQGAYPQFGIPNLWADHAVLHAKPCFMNILQTVVLCVPSALWSMGVPACVYPVGPGVFDEAMLVKVLATCGECWMAWGWHHCLPGFSLPDRSVVLIYAAVADKQ